MVIKLENDLKEEQVRGSKYRELYLKEVSERDLNKRAQAYVIRAIIDEGRVSSAKEWIKKADNYKKSSVFTKQHQKGGAASEKDVAEIARMIKELEKKEQERQRLEKLVMAKKIKRSQTMMQSVKGNSNNESKNEKRALSRAVSGTIVQQRKDVIVKTRNGGGTTKTSQQRKSPAQA